MLVLTAMPLCAIIDLDGDGISDVWTTRYGVTTTADADPDGDGLSNREEAIAGTAPGEAADRLFIAPEVDALSNLVIRWPSVVGKRYGIEHSSDLVTWTALAGTTDGTGGALSVTVTETGTLLPERLFWRVVVSDLDSDGDGLNDWEEAQLGTELHACDTDDDGLNDRAELEQGADPLRWSTANDGLPDGWKVANGFRPADSSIATLDSDGDGLTNFGEYQTGSDPTDFFNGEKPVLALVSGAGQSPVDGFLAQPVVLQVTHADGRPWSGALVTLDVVVGPGLWARTVGEAPTRQLIMHAASDGRVVAQYACSFQGVVTPAGDIASAATGRTPHQTKLEFLPVSAPVGIWDVWQEDFSFASRIVDVSDGAIGFQDLSLLPYANKPSRGPQIRTYRKRETRLHYSLSGEAAQLSDDQSISVRRNDDGTYLVSGTTRYSAVSGSSWTSGSGELLPAMASLINDPMPQSQLVISGSAGGDFSGVAFLLPGVSSTPYGSYCREKDYQALPSCFPGTPSSWSLDHVLLSDSDGNTFEIALSEEDTVDAIRARFALSKAIADGIATLPMGTDRSVRNGGAIIRDLPDWAPTYPVIHLVNLEEFSAVAPTAEYGRAEFRVSVPEESFSRAAGASFRARFVVLFIPDESPDSPEVADVLECTLSPENNWESPVYSITPQADGYTDILAWSMVAESSRPRRLIPGQTHPCATGPMEYVGKKPQLAWEPMVPDPEANGPWRRALQGSHTLQQVFLRDDYYSSVIADVETTVTWAPIPGSTVPIRLWCWHDDGSDLGRWSLLSEGCDLKPYLGATTDLLFFEALAPGFITVRFTTMIEEAAVHDDIRIDASLPLPSLGLDANRDGEIKLPSEDDSDATSADKPFRFWINDDDDHFSSSTGDGDSYVENAYDVLGSATPNYLESQATSARDLEDFARLWISTQGLNASFKNGDLYLGLKWADEGKTGAPAIKLFRQVESTGGIGYLSSMSVASQQIKEFAIRDASDSNPWDSLRRQVVQGSDVFVLPTSVFSQLSETAPTTHLLFEGAGVGKGQLKIVILKKEGDNFTTIGEGPGVWLDLQNIKSMYERAKATADGAENFPFPYNYAGADVVPSPAMGWASDPSGYPFEPEQGERSTYIVFVHGWNMEYAASTNYAETMFKRMWQRGYKGRFVSFRWPTFTGLTTFNDSEYRAWKCGVSMKQYIATLPTSFTVNLVAHSMGNIVAGSALENGASVANYALLNAAVPAICYDTTGNVVQTSWRYVTPNDDPDPATVALSYQGRLAGVSGNLVNFFLPADSALSAWELNNELFKPHQWPEGSIDHAGYGYQRTAGAGQKLRVVRVAGNRFLGLPDEAMAFAVQAPSLTVGADGRTRGSITEWVDLSTYGFDNVHSAEFLFTIQQTRNFYGTVLLKLGVAVQP